MAEETKEEGTTEERRTDENVIYVGSKPPMSYVLAVVTQSVTYIFSDNSLLLNGEKGSGLSHFSLPILFFFFFYYILPIVRC